MKRCSVDEISIIKTSMSVLNETVGVVMGVISGDEISLFMHGTNLIFI